MKKRRKIIRADEEFVALVEQIRQNLNISIPDATLLIAKDYYENKQKKNNNKFRLKI